MMIDHIVIYFSSHEERRGHALRNSIADHNHDSLARLMTDLRCPLDVDTGIVAWDEREGRDRLTSEQASERGGSHGSSSAAMWATSCPSMTTGRF
jgi:hypothetical protein